MALKRVVFPDPFGPISPTLSPCSIVNETSLTAITERCSESLTSANVPPVINSFVSSWAAEESLFINFLVSIIFGLLLLYFVFQKIDLSVFFARLDSVNYSWIWLSIIISIFEHIIRAFRWNLLMEKESDSLTTFNTTIVLIVSYFTSLIFPRFNDFVRCYLISKTNTIKLSTSLGTVVSERIVDVLSLIVLALLLLVIEYEIFVNLLIDIVSKINFDFINVVFIVIAIVIGIVITVTVQFL